MKNKKSYSESESLLISLGSSIEQSLENQIKQPSDGFIHQIVFRHYHRYPEDQKADPKDRDRDSFLIQTIRLFIQYYIEDSGYEISNENSIEAYNSYLQCVSDFMPIKNNLPCIVTKHPNKILVEDIVHLILHRELAKHAYAHKLYDIALQYNVYAFEIYGKIKYRDHIGDDFSRRLSEENRQKALSYWQPINEEKEQLRAKYLRIMKEQGFTKYTDAAEYIYAESNPEKKKYRYIYDALREADK